MLGYRNMGSPKLLRRKSSRTMEDGCTTVAEVESPCPVYMLLPARTHPKTQRPLAVMAELDHRIGGIERKANISAVDIMTLCLLPL